MVERRSGSDASRRTPESPESAWRGKYWRVWSDALVEAGFAPNLPQERYADSELIEVMVALTRKLGRCPAEVDLQMERSTGNDIPSSKRFRVRFGAHRARVAAVRAHAVEHDYQDVLALLPIEDHDEPAAGSTSPRRHGPRRGARVSAEARQVLQRYRSDAVPTRHRQINRELFVKAELIHKIATDDAVGIENYWHTRFAEKRTNGEWFELSRQDIAAFKRRKFM